MKTIVAAALLTAVGTAPSLAGPPSSKSYPLDTLDGIEALNLKPEVGTFQGRRAVHLVDRPRPIAADAKGGGDGMLIVAGTDFENGTIEAEVAGSPREGAKPEMRGFVGIAFRISPDAAGYECFYLRPTNGRADDQLRRNHAVQYAAFPGWPWDRLRKETPGVYEAYTDLEPGVWTKIRIEAEGTKARFYVNGAAQATLIVNDLKLGPSRGKVGFWIGVDTDACFSNLVVRQADSSQSPVGTTPPEPPSISPFAPARACGGAPPSAR